MAYTTDTNNRILEFINRAQSKIAQTAILISDRVARGSRRDSFGADSEMAYMLSSFVKSLDNRHNDWTEEEIVRAIDMWSNAASLTSEQPFFEHEKFNLRIRFISSVGGSGFTPSEDLNMLGYKIINLGSGSGASDAVNKSQLDTKVSKGGDSMTGPLAMGGQKVTGLGAASSPGEAVRFEQMPTSLPPSGAAGGGLNGTFPNPGVNNDGHSHTPGVTIPAYPTTLPPSGAAGGDLAGSYPNPALAADRVRKAGDTMSGNLVFSGGAKITGLPQSSSAGEAVVHEQLPTGNTEFTTVAGTSYTILSSDKGKIIKCTSSSPVTITVPAGLVAGFECAVWRAGTGTVTIATSGTTLNSIGSMTSIASTHGAVALTHEGGNSYLLVGNLV